MMHYEIVNTKEKFIFRYYTLIDITGALLRANEVDLNCCDDIWNVNFRLKGINIFGTASNNIFFSEEECNDLSEYFDNYVIRCLSGHSQKVIDDLKRFSNFCYEANNNGGFKVIQ